MRRCVECGRPYRGGLLAPALLELALVELGDAGLDGEHLRDLARVRELVRRVEMRIDAAMATQAERLAAGSTRQANTRISVVTETSELFCPAK